MIEDDDIEPFEAPTRPPQMEFEANSSLVDLLEGAPRWDAAFAVELVILARRHVCLRSLLGFPLELAKISHDKLMGENEPNEMFRHQGAVRACTQLHNTIFENLVAADEYVRAQTQEPDDENQSPSFVP